MWDWRYFPWYGRISRKNSPRTFELTLEKVLCTGMNFHIIDMVLIHGLRSITRTD